MSSRVAIRALGAGLGLLLLVGSAQAGTVFPSFGECANPATVPTAVLTTIFDDGSDGFGNLSEKVCSGIVKKGVSLCKAQVKLAQKCNEKTVSSLNDTLLKQCAQLTDAGQRSTCKTGVKDDVSTFKDGNKANRTTGIAFCEGSFADDLANACANGIVM